MSTARKATPTPRTKARAALKKAGLSVPEWARANGFSVDTVKAVLYGKAIGNRGEAHRVAVALGIKQGEVVNPKGWQPVPVIKPRLTLVEGAES